MLLNILTHTPAWVWGLLAALTAFGIWQSLPRSVPLRRVAVLPLVMLGLSLVGVLSSFGAQPLAVVAWALGVGASVQLLRGRIDTSAVRYTVASRRFELPGSVWPLALILALFALKYGVGVALALHPSLAGQLPLALSVSLSYGVFSGIFLARALALWSMARQRPPELLHA